MTPPLLENRVVMLGGTVSVLAARHAIDELDRRGVDAGPVLRRVGLSREILTGGEGRLPHRTVRDLWEAAAVVARDRWLGVHVGESLTLGSQDLVDYLFVSAGTVGAGLAAVARYARLIDDDPEWRLDGARLRRHAAVPAPQLDELVLTWLVVRGRQASAVRWSPERVAFQHERPDDDGELARLLGCPVTFGAAETELRLAPSVLGLPHVRPDPRLFAILARSAEALLASLPRRGDLVASVSTTIARQLASAAPYLPTTAAAVHVPPRTLQRRLAERGLSHSTLVDGVRRGLALQYLAESRLTVGEIAYRLRFADTTAFHRAFKRWTGSAPSQYRRQRHPEG